MYHKDLPKMLDLPASTERRDSTISQEDLCRCPGTETITSALLSEGMAYTHERRRSEALAELVHEVAVESSWMETFQDDIYCSQSSLGAFVMRPDGEFAKTSEDYIVLRAVDSFEPCVAVTYSTAAIGMLINDTNADQRSIQFSDGFEIVVVNSVEDIAKESLFVGEDLGCCLCRQERFMLLWATTPAQLFEEADCLDARLARRIRGDPTPEAPSAASDSDPFSTVAIYCSLPSPHDTPPSLTPDNSPSSHSASSLFTLPWTPFQSFSPPPSPTPNHGKGNNKIKRPFWSRSYSTHRVCLETDG